MSTAGTKGAADPAPVEDFGAGGNHLRPAAAAARRGGVAAERLDVGLAFRLRQRVWYSNHPGGASRIGGIRDLARASPAGEATMPLTIEVEQEEDGRWLAE